jgi:hypothetical protein
LIDFGNSSVSLTRHFGNTTIIKEYDGEREPSAPQGLTLACDAVERHSRSSDSHSTDVDDFKAKVLTAMKGLMPAGDPAKQDLQQAFKWATMNDRLRALKAACLKHDPALPPVPDFHPFPYDRAVPAAPSSGPSS